MDTVISQELGQIQGQNSEQERSGPSFHRLSVYERREALSNYNNTDEFYDGDEIQSIMGPYGRSIQRV